MNERKFFQVATDYFDEIRTDEKIIELKQEPCPRCNDTGMIRVTEHPVAPDDPDFGKLTHCDHPDCRVASANRRRLQELRWKSSRMPVEYQDWTFDRWYRTPEDILRHKELATVACEIFAHNLEISLADVYAGFLTCFKGHERYAEMEDRLQTASDQKQPWLLITDGVKDVNEPHKPYRTGKTTLASCVVNARNGTCLYTRCHDMIQEIQETYGSGQSTEAVMRSYQECPMLIIDELRINNSNARDQVDKLTQILRYRAGYRLPTLFTTNFSLQMLDEMLGREAADLFHRACLSIAIRGKQVLPDKQVIL